MTIANLVLSLYQYMIGKRKKAPTKSISHTH